MKKSKVVTYFIVAYPNEGAKATYDIEVQLLYNPNSIYVFARCYFLTGKRSRSRTFSVTSVSVTMLARIRLSKGPSDIQEHLWTVE